MSCAGAGPSQSDLERVGNPREELPDAKYPATLNAWGNLPSSYTSVGRTNESTPISNESPASSLRSTGAYASR